MRSGIPNFCAVALALNDLGYVQKVYLNLSALPVESWPTVLPLGG